MKDSLLELIAAAKHVVAQWNGGDLADAVNNLERTALEAEVELERAAVRPSDVAQKDFWLVSHSHRHGQNHYLFDHKPTLDEAITFLGDCWEPDRDESIEIDPIDMVSGTTITSAKTPTPRVVICLQGGIVNDILGDAPVEVAIVDYDTDGADPDDDKIVAIDQGDGFETDAFARIEDAYLNLTRVNEIFASFEEPTTPPA